MLGGYEIQVFDGVAFASAGDTTLVVYALPARVDRSRWLYDRLDEAASRTDAQLVGLLVILPTADLPDAPTRAENERRLRQLQGRLRRIVTVALGGGVRFNLIRAVMRGMLMVQNRSYEHFVASTLDDGLRQMLRDATKLTPARAAVDATLQAMFARLGCSELAPVQKSP